MNRVWSFDDRLLRTVQKEYEYTANACVSDSEPGRKSTVRAETKQVMHELTFVS